MKNSGIIRLTDISKSYYLGKERVQVLDKVSLSLASGCFTVIAGPSGSGKSTLLNILGCLDLPESGEYLLNGNPVDFRKKTKLAELRKENFGFIFQSFNLIPVLTAQENVELPLTLFGLNEKEIRERAQGMLDLVGLADKFRNKPSEMSGGQQQRVAIARAMVSNPKIIFADEPTANLDRKTATKIIDLMLNLNEEKGISFVFASHDDLVISSAKELFKVNSGKIELNHDIMIS